MSARFSVGDRVRVLASSKPGHIRTPTYVMGRTGIVAKVHGEFRDPESLAYGGGGLPALALYYVRFAGRDLWGDDSSANAIDVDLYETWLEPA